MHSPDSTTTTDPDTGSTTRNLRLNRVRLNHQQRRMNWRVNRRWTARGIWSNNALKALYKITKGKAAGVPKIVEQVRRIQREGQRPITKKRVCKALAALVDGRICEIIRRNYYRIIMIFKPLPAKLAMVTESPHKRIRIGRKRNIVRGRCVGAKRVGAGKKPKPSGVAVRTNGVRGRGKLAGRGRIRGGVRGKLVGGLEGIRFGTRGKRIACGQAPATAIERWVGG